MLTYDQIDDIITNRRFNEMIGKYETDLLDAKSDLYQLKDDYGKSELAKDTSALANHKGGYLIIGLRTEKDKTSLAEIITEFRPFEQQYFDVEQYRQTLNSWVYPSIDTLNVQWVEIDSKARKGLGIITVPPQPREKKPFLITKIILDTGKRRDILVGYAQRWHDQVDLISFEEMHQFIRSGMQYELLLSRGFDELHARFDLITEATRTTHHLLIEQEDVSERINRQVTDVGLNYKPYIAFAAHADIDLELPTLFTSREGSLGRLVGDPPMLRSGGFGIWASGDSSIIDGTYRRSLCPSDDILDGIILALYRDGTLIFVTGARQFCWQMEAENKINALSLVETAYNFCTFFQHVLDDSGVTPDWVTIRARISRPSQTQPFILPPGPLTVRPWPPRIPPGKIKEACVDLDTSLPANRFDPAAAAVKLLEEIYIRFGLETDMIPYVVEIDGVRRVNVEEIRNRHT